MINNNIIESFLKCKYKAYLLLRNQSGIKKDYEIMQKFMRDELFIKFHNQLKEKFGERNLVSTLDLDVFSNGKNPKLAINQVLDKELYYLMINGLEINYGKSALKNGRVILYLFSEKEKVSKYDKLYLTIQSILFSKIKGIDVNVGRIYYGKQVNTLKFKMQKFFPECLRIIQDIENISTLKTEPILCQNNHCKMCEFEELCHTKLVEKDDLSLLSSIGEKELVRYEKKGIFTIKQLSYIFRPRKRNERIDSKKHPYYASLQALAIRDKKVFVYDKIEMPDCKTKIFFDCEGNTENNLIYLIGLLVEDQDSQRTYSFWADSKDEEITIFEDFIKVLSIYKEPYIFYYGKYDWRVLKRILSKTNNHKIKKIILENSIDVLKRIRRNIYFPTYSNSLKEIAKYLGFYWSDSQASGLQSVVWRFNWERTREPGIKDKIITYNQEDCIALKTLVDFLYRLSFRSTEKNTADTQANNVFYIKDMKTREVRQFKVMDYATPDIEIITKGAYFEYQRSKIYFRTNKNLKKVKRIKEREEVFYYKPNEVIRIKTDKCISCHSKNISENIRCPFQKTVLDLKFFKYGIKRRITKYETNQYICLDCKKKFVPKRFRKIVIYSRRGYIPKGIVKKNQLGFGQNLISWVIYQNVINQTPYRTLEMNFKDFFRIHAIHSDVWGFKIIGANYYNKTYEKILGRLLNGNLIHIDETKINLRDKSGYIWVFTNMEEVLYLYRPNRESDFLKDLLKGFNGVLVTDFYPGYDSVNCKKQRCLIHLVRDLNDSLLDAPFDDEVKEIVHSFGALIRTIISTTDKYGLKRRFLNKHKKDINNYFKTLKSRQLKSEIADKIKKRLTDYKEELFTFLDYDGIPWNNNNAEYAVKHFAVYRGIMKGSMTENGLEAYLTLLSIYLTCKYKGVSFLDFLLSKEKDIYKFQTGT